MEMITKILIVISLSMALATYLPKANAEVEEGEYPATSSSAGDLLSNEEEPLSLRGTSRFLTASMTCSNFPRLCRYKGSPLPDCCNKKCVNVATDNLNCGQCGKKCKNGEACCGQKCVKVATDNQNCGKCGKKCKFTEACCNSICINVRDDPKNCGSCKNKCKMGSSCSFGMCNYA